MKNLFVIPGILLLSPAFAYYNDVYTNNIPNACGDLSGLYAEFTPFNYTCDAGYFLPADTLGCRACPADYTCDGGTFSFDDTEYQGAKESTTYITNDLTNMCSVNALHELIAIFTPNQYKCGAGHYLPADATECSTCPADSYCVGGTYTFNETLTQGIVSCGTGLFAPSGMWEAAQCGRILHVGDGFVYLRSTKITEHALHVDIDHDGVADYFGNMTTLDVPMSRDTQRKLKVRMNGVVYSIYDDSVDLSLYE